MTVGDTQPHPDKINLVAMFGLGDAYLVCAFAKAFGDHHKQPFRILLKESQAAIAGLFGPGVPVELVPDAWVEDWQRDPPRCAEYDNRLELGRNYFVHPHFVRSRVRIDHLTVKPSVTQADMYRALMHLPPDAPMTVPDLPFRELSVPGTVFMVPRARSWPNSAPAFWEALAAALTDAGFLLAWNEPEWPLEWALDRATRSEWVIGPQCGFMAALCEARFPCRKTICTPAIEPDGMAGFPLRATFPYAYVTKFAGNDYDIEEYRIDADHDGLVRRILAGKNALRLPHDPAPVRTVNVDISPGDLFDRLSILTVKCGKFDGASRAAVLRETARLDNAAAPLLTSPAIASAYLALGSANLEAFEANEIMVRETFAGTGGQEAHERAVRANKLRVEAKNRINELCGSAWREVKSYYEAAE